MGLTTAYRDHLLGLAIGEALTPFNGANAAIGVGDSTAVFGAGQTDLQAATNKVRKAVDTGYPTRSGNVTTFRALFSQSEANFSWDEWGVFNALTGGVMMNRKVEPLGTKPSTQSWQITTTVEVTLA